jgi:hypothetical protein
MINKIKGFLARNACDECDYYNPENGVCQSKKIATCGCHPCVNWFDKHFCEPRKIDIIDKEKTGKMYGSYSENKLIEWSHRPAVAYIFATEVFGAWLARRDEIRDRESLAQIKEKICEEAEYAYADFDQYKDEVLGAEADELPDDDFRYGMERCVDIINDYLREQYR